MTNFTVNPKGILILVYEDGTSVDLDLRYSIIKEELNDSIVIHEGKDSLIFENHIRRREVVLDYVVNMPEWYKVLRLIHRATIKYLSKKESSAYNLLEEIKESLKSLEIHNLDFKGGFEEDLQCVLWEICNRFTVDKRIVKLFLELFREF